GQQVSERVTARGDVGVMAAISVFDPPWYEQARVQKGLPPLGRLWGLAGHLRDKNCPRKVSDAELFALTAATLRYCAGRFDPERMPKQGMPRLDAADRFVRFFGRALAWRLRDYRKRLRRQNGPRRGDIAYRGPRGDEYEAARKPRCKTALLEAVH